MRTHSLACFLILSLIPFSGLSQVFERPNAVAKSHAELMISSLEITRDYTIVHLVNRNMLATGAWACVDENTVIRTTDNKRHKLIRAENIPLCPEKHLFDSIGEFHEFTLYFPPIDPSKGSVDLVEICAQSCFYFQGIILDNKLNRDIYAFDRAFDLYSRKEYGAAMEEFAGIVRDIPHNPTHIYGFSFYYLVLINHELGKRQEANGWLKRLKDSGLPDRDTFLQKLRELSIE